MVLGWTLSLILMPMETDGEEFVYPPVGESIAPGANSVQIPPPLTTSTPMLYGPTTSSSNGFSKFFVQLPSSPLPVRKATSEELLKLSDTLTSAQDDAFCHW
jgi:hypothetical protein